MDVNLESVKELSGWMAFLAYIVRQSLRQRNGSTKSPTMRELLDGIEKIQAGQEERKEKAQEDKLEVLEELARIHRRIA